MRECDCSSSTPLPKVGETYDCFDDGKVRESRRYKVLITRLIPYEDAIKNEYIRHLCESNISEKDKRNDYQLFAVRSKQDYIVEAISYEEYRPHVCYFARMKYQGWFGLGTMDFDFEDKVTYNNNFWCSGSLDVDGSRWQKYLKDIEEFKEKYNSK